MSLPKTIRLPIASLWLAFTAAAVHMFVPLSGPAQAQDDPCVQTYTVLPEVCVQRNAISAVRTPAGPNIEYESGRVTNDAGFVISIDGQPINSSRHIEDRIRQADLALARANIRIQYDGLDSTPRLDLKFRTAPGLGEGGIARFESRMNYPAFVSRSEIRIIDRGATSGPKLLYTADIAPNGTADVAIPAGRDVVAVHRVYDTRGRYDETKPMPLSVRDDHGLAFGTEEGLSTLASQRIPVFGGAVTVSSNNLPPGASVRTLGETRPADPNGSFVMQRILPPGAYVVTVDVVDTGQAFERAVDIPRTDWFYVAMADITYGRRDTDNPSLASEYTRGRLTFYSKSKHANGVTVTASADTGEDELDELLSNLTKKDPRSLLERVDPLSVYPTYGDDSTSTDDTPTSGRVYLKIEKDGNFLLWGDYKARLSGNAYLRNERQLYGLNAHWASDAQTGQGEPRTELTAYAAEPETLPGRDVFQGTGGSVFFLQRQDIQIGSETVTIEFRDRETGRVLDRQQLQQGVDYSVNYIQGVVILSEPLRSHQSAGLIVTNPGGDAQTNLAVQYEYAPTFADIGGYSLGARAQAWATDRLRFGVAATDDTTGAGSQHAYAADVVYQIGENSYIRLDYAKSDGPGFGSSFSTDGGLIVNNTAAPRGTGEAYRLETRLAFRDLSMENDGVLGLYAERREQGFSTLDHQTTATTGDEDFRGVFLETRPSDQLRLSLSYDNYSNAVKDYKRETNVELGFHFSDAVKLSFGAEYIERKTGGTVGNRTDLAFRLDVVRDDHRSWYVFGQVTADRDGLADNDRYGVGASYKVSDTLALDAELSDGTYGLGGRVLFEYRKDDNNSLYFGYELDPARQIANGTNYGTDNGRFVQGSKRRVNDDWSTFAENSYDLFSQRNSLSSAYGVTYRANTFLSYDGAVEVSRVEDEVDGDFDRTALSFGLQYQGDRLTAQGRLEYRKERGIVSGNSRDADTYLLRASGRYKKSDAERFLFSLNAAFTDTDQSSVLDGELADLQLGYAFRPINNDRLNVVARYRYLNDMYGQRIDGSDTRGPQQRSHILSLDATYDISRHWTVGAKVGGRWSESAPAGSGNFSENDALIGVLNARYHLAHNWDLLVEWRGLRLEQGGTTETGLVVAAYRHIRGNVKFGVGYNAGNFSDDLTDLTFDDRGVFVNLVVKF